ncbi:MAG: LysE family translocator [Granulosicoccus sp.]|nr:LysE family translocator [Granulosicoccus sp.]
MSYSDTASYIVTLLAITLAPGPVALMLIVRSASNDVLGALSFGIGFAIGGVMIISVVCFGLGAWLTAVPETFEYSKYVMLAYMIWLARGVWMGGFDLEGECPSRNGTPWYSLGAGIVTCFISPYMMILFPLVLPSLLDISTIKLPQFLVLSVTTFAALIAGSILIIAFAAQIRRLFRSPRSMMILRRSLSCILVFGGGWMAFS